MKAVVVAPGQAGSGRLQEVPDPTRRSGEVLVRVHEIGIDGTDAESLEGQYGEAPPGDDYLIIGHESLGRVETVTDGAEDLAPGDWVVAMVRRPDPVPCRNCAAGEWDMCLNGLYTERGIKGLHGFLAEYYVEQPRYLVKLPGELAAVGVLLEPLTIAEKAVDQIQRIQSRLVWEPKRAVILRSGPVGLPAGSLRHRKRNPATFRIRSAASERDRGALARPPSAHNHRAASHRAVCRRCSAGAERCQEGGRSRSHHRQRSDRW